MNTTTEIKPTKIIRPFTEAPMEIRLLGRPLDWSIAKLQNPGDGDRPENQDLVKRLDLITTLENPRKDYTLLAPRPATFNAVICDRFQLNKTVAFGLGFDKKQWEEYLRPLLMRGVDADGCDVPKGSAFWLSSADCPLILLYDPDTCFLICGHGGFECLQDKQTQLTGKRSRPFPSIVDSMMEVIRKHDVPARRLQYFLTCGIAEFPISREQYNKRYEIIVRWAQAMGQDCYTINERGTFIRLGNIIRSQLRHHGVILRPEDSDGVDTFSDKEKGEHTWWSYERAVLESPDETLKRNGVMVIHG